jgi:hypothetical protein
MHFEELFAIVFTVSIFSGVAIVMMGLRQRSKQMEMQHRERMAMIERGQIPLSEPTGGPARYSSGGAASSRALSIGIVIVGIGMALMTMISIAGDSPEAGVGVGGAIAIIGGAFIVRSYVVRPESGQARRDSLPPDGGA